MTLVQIGQLTLNLDAVTSIRDLSVRDASGTVVQGLYRVEFVQGPPIEIARDADALRQYIAAHATVMPQTP